MPLTLSSVAVEEKNKLATASVFLVALEITIPGTAEPVRVVQNSENITWQGETWVAFPFEVSELGDTSKGEVPKVTIKVGNASGVMGNYVRQYDAYCKAERLFSDRCQDLRGQHPGDHGQGGHRDQPGPGATATVVCTGHRFSSGQSVCIAGAGQTEYNGLQTVTVTGANSFTYPVAGTPATPATGTITSSLASPEVEYQLELKQPTSDRTWASFTLGASNPFARRFPQAMILKNHCRYRFKGARCGYAGAETACDHTLARCREAGQFHAIRGRPGGWICRIFG